MPNAPFFVMLSPFKIATWAVSMALSWLSVYSDDVGADVPAGGMVSRSEFSSDPLGALLLAR